MDPGSRPRVWPGLESETGVRSVILTARAMGG